MEQVKIFQGEPRDKTFEKEISDWLENQVKIRYGIASERFKVTRVLQNIDESGHLVTITIFYETAYFGPNTPHL